MCQRGGILLDFFSFFFASCVKYFNVLETDSPTLHPPRLLSGVMAFHLQCERAMRVERATQRFDASVSNHNTTGYCWRSQDIILVRLEITSLLTR